MNTACCPTTIPLTRPLHQRLLDAAADGLHSLRREWQRHAEERRLERELDAMADMNELLLRDIGAPEWLIARAGERREMERQELRQLHQWQRNF
ncbi:MAG TPA: hypothetical protein VGE16_19275 [Albitalea sp.]